MLIELPSFGKPEGLLRKVPAENPRKSTSDDATTSTWTDLLVDRIWIWVARQYSSEFLHPLCLGAKRD